MSPRYLLLVGTDDQRQQLSRRLRESTGLQLAFSSSSFVALANPGCRCVAVADAGCILGSLFPRQGPPQPLTFLSASEVRRIWATGGSMLPSSFWGGYVAAIAGSDAFTVLRDPSGTFPCYHAQAGSVEVFASDAELLIAAGVTTDIDFDQVGRQLYRAFVPSPATALSGIRELLPGFTLNVDDKNEPPQSCWSPWDHVADPGLDPDTAATRLSQVVRGCVRGWASTRRRLLLSISGGLDSSIIAACLARADVETVCLTMFAGDPAGDERPFARALCEHLGLQLVERPYRLEDVDITEALGAHLPRPRDRTQANAYERVHLQVAEELAADAFVTGNGGDNVFGYSQSAAPIADRYLSEGLGRGLWQSLLDVCEQTGCSVFDAAKQACRLTRGSPAHAIRPNPLFLAGEFVRSLASEELYHPWLDPRSGALPGKAAHISAILRVQPNLEASRGYYLPVLSPLMSQPIIETCLAIPTWAWRAGGRDRAVARRAFANDLPSAVLNRRVKGTPSRFAARLLDHYRSPIRERLLGGRLAKHGIIDKMALERQLRGERPVPDLERVRILELVNVEAWLDHWAMKKRVPTS